MRTSKLWTALFISTIFMGPLQNASARKHLCNRCKGQTHAHPTPHPGMTALEAMHARRLSHAGENDESMGAQAQ